MVRAHMDEFWLAGLAFRLPVLRRPGEHAAQRIGVARAVEEIVRRGLRLVALPCRVGQGRRVGARRRTGIWSCATKPVNASVSAVPQPRMAATLSPDPFLVLADGARHLVAVVDGVEVDLCAIHAALLVDPADGVGGALAVRHADVRGGARIVRKLSDGDLRVRGRCREQHRQRRAA